MKEVIKFIYNMKIGYIGLTLLRKLFVAKVISVIRTFIISKKNYIFRKIAQRLSVNSKTQSSRRPLQ